MCGIVGVFHFDKERLVSHETLNKMMNSVSHRGPDGEGLFINKNVGLGHRRLSIIDISGGGQPMFNLNNTISLVFNGEVYNYIELKKELQDSGQEFISNSDTEVIIKAYEVWGINFFHKLNGMWSLALWDEKKRLLIISRDRIGEKPLHYAVVDNSIVFGSEIKAILAYGVEKKQNEEVSDIYLNLGYIPAPFTYYKNIYKLNPGHNLIIQPDKYRIEKYWDLPEIDEDNMLKNKKHIYETFTNLFKDSVKIRMRSDAPFGAFLSGGLDSSSVVSVMSQYSSHSIETFTIGSENEMYDERDLARDVAHTFNTNHHEYIVGKGVLNEWVEKVLYYYDEPFADASAIPTSCVSRFASNKVKMVLTGDGGDEVLSGYTSYQGEKFAGYFQTLPKFIQRLSPNLLKAFPKPASASLKVKLKRLYNLLTTSSLSFDDRLILKQNYADFALIKSNIDLKGSIPIADYLSQIFKECKYKNEFYKLMYFHLKISLPDNMLTKVDRMSMANSLETRVPFLDHRIVEYMVNVDKNIKMEGFERKSILRNTFGKNLPSSILNSPKKGFDLPLGDWFKEKGYETELIQLFKTENLKNSNQIKDLIEDHKKGIEDYSNLFWMLLLLKKWRDKKD
ncbi:MAG TPA: asparagine synthase (glutamine-hydrolyzing) [Cytophagales bacterium]|nr:asparagine synthase (glutamine-hydrolyzing) [Cytophagales bacterium]